MVESSVGWVVKSWMESIAGDAGSDSTVFLEVALADFSKEGRLFFPGFDSEDTKFSVSGVFFELDTSGFSIPGLDVLGLVVFLGFCFLPEK